VLALISGIMTCLGGAMKIASAFKTQSSSTITGTGTGSGFFKFYSKSGISTMSLSVDNCGRYLQRLIDRMMRDQSPSLAAHKQSIIENLQDMADFETYAWGECDNMVNTITYNQGSGRLFFYIYTLSPFQASRGDAVKVQTMKIDLDITLAKDWMIVTKAKCNFFKSKVSSEIKYLPEKGVELKHIVEAISIAMAPAVIGLVQVPERFMVVLDKMFADQIANPDAGVPKADLDAQRQAYEQLKEMEDRQAQYEQNAQDGFKDIISALTPQEKADLGMPGSDINAPSI
jgi:hypothetical protein